MRKTIHTLLILFAIINCGGSYKLKQVMDCKADKIGITFILIPSNSRVKEHGHALVEKKIWVNDINKMKALCQLFSDKQVPPKICGHDCLVEYYKNEKIFFKLGINSACNYVSFRKNLKSEWRELTLSGKSVIEEYRDSLFSIIGSDWEY